MFFFSSFVHTTFFGGTPCCVSPEFSADDDSWGAGPFRREDSTQRTDLILLSNFLDHARNHPWQHPVWAGLRWIPLQFSHQSLPTRRGEVLRDLVLFTVVVCSFMASSKVCVYFASFYLFISLNAFFLCFLLLLSHLCVHPFFTYFYSDTSSPVLQVISGSIQEFCGITVSCLHGLAPPPPPLFICVTDTHRHTPCLWSLSGWVMGSSDWRLSGGLWIAVSDTPVAMGTPHCVTRSDLLNMHTIICVDLNILRWIMYSILMSYGSLGVSHSDHQNGVNICWIYDIWGKKDLENITWRIFPHTALTQLPIS